MRISLLTAALGALAGAAALALAAFAPGGPLGLNALGYGLGIWLFPAALLALKSPRSRAAGWRVFVYLAGAVISYHALKCLIAGPCGYAEYIPDYLDSGLYWLTMSGLCGVAGQGLHFAVRENRLGAALFAIPVSALLWEAALSASGATILAAADIAFAAALIFKFAGREKRLKSLPFISGISALLFLSSYLTGL